MTIPAASISADVNSAVGVRVARITLDAAEAQGEAAVALIRAAAGTGSGGGRGSIGPAPANPPVGGRLDVTG